MLFKRGIARFLVHWFEKVFWLQKIAEWAGYDPPGVPCPSRLSRPAKDDKEKVTQDEYGRCRSQVGEFWDLPAGCLWDGQSLETQLQAQHTRTMAEMVAVRLKATTLYTTLHFSRIAQASNNGGSVVM